MDIVESTTPTENLSKPGEVLENPDPVPQDPGSSIIENWINSTISDLQVKYNLSSNDAKPAKKEVGADTYKIGKMKYDPALFQNNEPEVKETFVYDRRRKAANFNPYYGGIKIPTRKYEVPQANKEKLEVKLANDWELGSSENKIAIPLRSYEQSADDVKKIENFPLQKKVLAVNNIEKNKHEKVAIPLRSYETFKENEKDLAFPGEKSRNAFMYKQKPWDYNEIRSQVDELSVCNEGVNDDMMSCYSLFTNYQENPGMMMKKDLRPKKSQEKPYFRGNMVKSEAVIPGKKKQHYEFNAKGLPTPLEKYVFALIGKILASENPNDIEVEPFEDAAITYKAIGFPVKQINLYKENWMNTDQWNLKRLCFAFKMHVSLVYNDEGKKYMALTFC